MDFNLQISGSTFAKEFKNFVFGLFRSRRCMEIQNWLKWYPEFSKKLGKPNPLGVKIGNTWKRTFESGAFVTFDTEKNVGKIIWADLLILLYVDFENHFN